MINEIAIVIAVHDNAPEVEQNLPKYLEQAFEAGFKVIVVDNSSTDDTVDMLKRFQSDYPQLYVTFNPASRHRNPKRLALTIGAKAAECEWVVLADICYIPESEQWLSHLVQAADGEHVKLVAGPCRRSRQISLIKRFRLWRKVSRLERNVKNKAEFDLPLNNVLIHKEMIVRKGRLTASCEHSVWVADAVLVK